MAESSFIHSPVRSGGSAGGPGGGNWLEPVQRLYPSTSSSAAERVSAVIIQFKVKVIDFGTNRKPACDCLLLNNIISELHPFLHCFQIIADYCQILLSTGILLFNTLVRDEPLNSTLRSLSSRS